MVSTSGAQLLPVEAVQILLRELLPLTTILTPNVPEAKLLLSQAGAIFNADPQSVDDLIELGKQIHKLGPKEVTCRCLPAKIARKRTRLFPTYSFLTIVQHR